MATVIEEVEATVEPGGTGRPSAGEGPVDQATGNKALLRDQLAGELRRMAARRERLKAD